MKDIRQSPEYANYIKSLGWQVEKIGRWYVFIRKFSLLGSLVKVQRIEPPIPFEKIEKLAKKHRAFQIIIEPTLSVFSSFFSNTSTNPQPIIFPHNYHPLKSPFLPTKTLVLDLQKPEEEIFASFTKNKRRDIQIAQRHNLKIKEGTKEQFYELKKKSLLRKGVLPFWTKKEIFPFCQAFGKKAKILLAFFSEKPVAGLILVSVGKRAYYWQAASTKKGYRLLAPTLLLWEAIKIAKKQGCQIFDFEGIYDERFPKNRSWLGFTHFKKGFGGKEVEFPLPFFSSKFPLTIL